MVRKFVFAVFALSLALGSAAWAQDRLTGRVQHFDASSRIVHFADGRIVHLSDNAVITVNGRQVAFDQVRPGMTVVVDTRPAGTPATVVTAPATPIVVDPWANHPPVDASGIVAHVDPATGMITFQDGRAVRMNSGTRVWNQGRVATVRPGDHVYVSGAQPAGYQALTPGVARPVVGTVTPAPGTRQYMGTIVSVDHNKAHILLNDGRIVKVSPATRMTMGDRTMTLAELRPGDQLVVTVAEPVPTAAVAQPTTVIVDRDAPSALPRQGANVILDASDIKIMRMHEAP